MATPPDRPVPGESRFCRGMVFVVPRFWVPVRIVLKLRGRGLQCGFPGQSRAEPGPPQCLCIGREGFALSS